MSDISAALIEIAQGRARDPLAPVTVIAPSHPAALQLRRRLAEIGPFASVRFETLPRIAELIGAGHLAAAGRSPLARPIGDYVAEQVARQSGGTLARVGDLRGYAVVLRRIFRRLRQGGIREGSKVRERYPGHLSEILRLYDRFRQMTAPFYDDEDLLDAATNATRAGRAGVLADLGGIYVVPPGAQSAGAADLLAALKGRAPFYAELDEPEAAPEVSMILAPDPASEAREVVREVLSALEAGVAINEIAVFHGADVAYRRLLREAFEAAEIPSVPLPGVPLSDTRAGRGVVALAILPDKDFSRTAMMDLFSIAPLRPWLPGTNGNVNAQPTAIDRVSRKAGITHGAARWSEATRALIAECDQRIAESEDPENDGRARMAGYEREQAQKLLDVIDPLIARLTPLRESQAAEPFIKSFKAVVHDYFRPDTVQLERVVSEIEQLGTVDAVGGSFSLSSFAQALAANLELACTRENAMGDGVVVADYRLAAGFQFKHVVLCGAYEGALPAGPGSDVLIDDRTWERLRQEYPYVEDARARVERAGAATRRAAASAGAGKLVWSAPLYEAGGTRARYPSHAMVAAAAAKDASVVTASQLTTHLASDSWLRCLRSPLAVMLTGTPIDDGEVRVRRSILRRQNSGVGDSHQVSMLRARAGNRFTGWDGNLAELKDNTWLELQKAVSPTSLEDYGVCGFRYLCKSLLRLRIVEEPEEAEVIDPAERGSLVHAVLEQFFQEQKLRGRPAVNEAWTGEDLDYLLRLLEGQLDSARRRGKTGLEVYASHDARSLRADMHRFLDADTAFRRETGAVPASFEMRIPEVEIAGVRLRGKVDRIDRTPDGRCAWVIDYKTGSRYGFDKMDSDPLAGGTKLQLPVYLAAAHDAEEAHAAYWFISRKGNFEFVPYESTPENTARFERTLRTIVTGIRAGAFPAVSGDEDERYGRFSNCKYCDFDRICSRRRDYEFAAKESDPAMAPWKAVAVAAGEDDQP